MKKAIIIHLLGFNEIVDIYSGLLRRALLKRKKGKPDHEMKVAKAEHPASNLLPSGPCIRDYFEKDNPVRLTPLQFQIQVLANKRHFETAYGENGFPDLLDKNDVVIVAVHIGASMALGVVHGIPKETLLKMNKDLFAPDLIIVLDSQPNIKTTGNALKDEENAKLAKAIQSTQKKLAGYYNWEVVDANKSPDEVHDDVFKVVAKMLEKVMVPAC